MYANKNARYNHSGFVQHMMMVIHFFLKLALKLCSQVAWIKSDSKAILAIHTNMVALNPRLSVTYNNHNTWKLHVSNVQANDSGTYMCQVNTDPMKSQARTMSSCFSQFSTYFC